ncbi:MAG: hypothetical protein U0525_00325 [Patescibacteria group bacterium]
MINKKYLIPATLTIFIIIGFSLRVLGFWDITFGYDQARDMIESMKIITSGDFLKLQGPMTDIPGLFHGSLYWYILAPFVYMAKGGPGFAKVILILINLSCIPLIYFVSKKMFSDSRIALLSAFLFAVSFEAVEYGRWMSNPSPALVPLLLSMYGLWLMTKKDIKGVLWFLLSWPFSIQFQFVLAYQSIFFAAILLWNFRPKDIVKNFRILIFGFLGSLVLVSPFIIGLIKFRFQSIGALLTHLSEKKSGGTSIITKAIDYFFYSVDPFTKNLLSIDKNLNVYLFVIFLLTAGFMAYKDRKNRGTILFLIFWIFSPFLIFSTGSLSAYFLTIGNLYGFLMISAYLLMRVYDLKLLTDKRINIFILVTLIIAITFSI